MHSALQRTTATMMTVSVSATCTALCVSAKMMMMATTSSSATELDVTVHTTRNVWIPRLLFLRKTIKTPTWTGFAGSVIASTSVSMRCQTTSMLFLWMSMLSSQRLTGWMPKVPPSPPPPPAAAAAVMVVTRVRTVMAGASPAVVGAAAPLLRS